MKLDHVNIRARDQEAMKEFLVDVLGLTVGDRPDFSFPGYWLYLGNQAIIHLQEADQGVPEGRGFVDHIAFGPFDFDKKRAHLKRLGVEFAVSEVPGRPLRQIFVPGPEGVKLELQCPARRSADNK